MSSLQVAITRCIVAVSFCLLTCFASASTINVPNQQPTIQAGINAAANGDTVLVAPGTYNENINFNGKAITVTSSGGPLVTIIDGGQNAYTVTFSSHETHAAIISGFTLRNGNQMVMYVATASPTIQNNVFMQNSYSPWGCDISLFSSDAIIQKNLFSNGMGLNSCAGAAIYVTGSSAAQITGNVISASGSGVYAESLTAVLTLTSNTITENQNTGIYDWYSYTGGQITLVQNVITDNGGVGVYWTNPPVTMINNTIAGNRGSFYCCNNASEIIGDTINNQVTMQNNLVVASGSDPALSCNSYDYSNPGIIDHNDIFAANVLSYGGSCPDLTGTSNNISADPMFAALLSDNLHLTTGSPAINAGNNSAAQLPSKDMDGDPRLVGTAVDIGADEYTSKTLLKLSTYDLRFGSVNAGSTSTAKTITLSNSGTAAVTLSLIATGPEFSQSNTCGTSLAAAGKCTISIKFSPAASDFRTGVLAIMTGATLNPITAVLNGTGLTPNVSLNPGNISFYSQMIGTSATQISTLTNTGEAPLAITALSLSAPADFHETSNCPIVPATLAVAGSCTISITWLPAVVGNEGGTLTISDNASPNTQTMYVNGSSYSAGIPSIAPPTLTFPTTLIGSTSAAQTFTLTNTGTGALGNISVSSYYDFPITSSCPTSLAAGASCTVSVSFAPSAVGTESGYVWVNDDGANGASISVNGQGQAPLPSIASLSPSNVAAGSGDTPLTVIGSGFIGGTQVLYNGVPLWSYNNGSNQLTVILPAPSLAQPGTGTITVYNPSPGGGTSNPLTFTIYAPVNYGVQKTAYAYKTISGTNLGLSPWSSATITSPFAIQFGGGNFNNLTVAGAGTISFSGFAGSPWNNSPLPYNATSTLIAPFWTALNPFGTGTNNNVFWQVTGTAPSRQLVVEWRNVEYYYAPATTQTVKFEVIFYEGNSQIRFNYADTVFGGSAGAADNGATASVGVQVSPTLGYQFSYNTASLAGSTSLLWYPNAPTATVSTNTLNFGWEQIGTSSAAQKLTLTNGSLVPLYMSGISTNNSDFTATNNCGSTLAAGSICSISVTFNPSSPVAESATLTINDDALGEPQTVTLNGVGAIQSTVVFPINLRFGLQNVGTSATLPVTLANASNATMTIQSITATPSVYKQTNNCGSSLAPGASCTINVTFTPIATGLVNGTLSMALNGAAPQGMVSISGQGQ